VGSLGIERRGLETRSRQISARWNWVQNGGKKAGRDPVASGEGNLGRAIDAERRARPVASSPSDGFANFRVKAKKKTSKIIHERTLKENVNLSHAPIYQDGAQRRQDMRAVTAVWERGLDWGKPPEKRAT